MNKYVHLDVPTVIPSSNTFPALSPPPPPAYTNIVSRAEPLDLGLCVCDACATVGTVCEGRVEW